MARNRVVQVSAFTFNGNIEVGFLREKGFHRYVNPSQESLRMLDDALRHLALTGRLLAIPHAAYAVGWTAMQW